MNQVWKRLVLDSVSLSLSLSAIALSGVYWSSVHYVFETIPWLFWG